MTGYWLRKVSRRSVLTWVRRVKPQERFRKPPFNELNVLWVQFDSDCRAFQDLEHTQRRTTSSKGIDHQVTGVGRCQDHSFDESLWLLCRMILPFGV